MTSPDLAAARAAAEAPRPPRRFTVLLPVLRPPATLPHAIRSVLAQTEPDLELCVVCDGAPPDTAEAARAFAAEDPRVHVFPFPKGERHGEAHRAATLRGARADFVAQIGDDDLWLPDHLARLAALLARADFVSTPQIRVHADGRLAPPAAFGDLRDPAARARMQTQPWNFFGPTEAGYRLSAYRALPEGWSPAPPGLPTDLFMWRKFLAHPGLRVGSAFAPTTLKFAADDWKNHPLEARAAVIAGWAEALADPVRRRRIRARAARAVPMRAGPADLLRLARRSPAEGLPLAARKLLHAAGRRLGRGAG